MKKLILLMLVSISVNAKGVFQTPNQGNGNIVLTNEACKSGDQNYPAFRRAYNYDSQGNTAEGCWQVQDNTIVVVWNNPYDQKGYSVRRYPMEGFTKLP